MTYIYTSVPVAKNMSVCPPRIYLTREEFLKFVERFRNDIQLIVHTRKGTFSTVEVYIAFYKHFIAICKTKERIPIEIDLEAKKISGIWI
ncbi:MAG: hypothetical protein ACP6IP_02120 [Candidatus Njordarchaeia archaeon]